MFRCLAGFVLCFLLALMGASTVAAADCQFVLGFNTLRDLIGHNIVGECLENEHYNEIGDSVQQTTGGLMAWRKADNWTAFTDGYRTWVNGPNGLQQRLNTERFEWEADYAPGGGVATPTPEPIRINGIGRTTTDSITVPYFNAIVSISHGLGQSLGSHSFYVKVYGDNVSSTKYYGTNCVEKSARLVNEGRFRGAYSGDRPILYCREDTIGEVIFEIYAPNEGEWEIEIRPLHDSPDVAIAGFRGSGDKASEVSGLFESPGVQVWDFEHDGEGTFEVEAMCSGTISSITIVSKRGTFSGSDVANLPTEGHCILVVRASGPFSVVPRG